MTETSLTKNALQREIENRAAVEPYLERNRSQKSIEHVIFEGRNYAVFPGVFAPNVYEDTYFFAEQLLARPCSRVLEVGTGAGLIGVSLATRRAEFVLCTDINPHAIDNCRHNAYVNGVAHRVEAVLCDVFPEEFQGARFDVIFWNAPFIWTSAPCTDVLARSVFDHGYLGIERYLEKVRAFIREDGYVYLGFSPTTGDMEVLRHLFCKYGWSYSVVNGMSFSDGFVLQLLHLVNNFTGAEAHP